MPICSGITAGTTFASAVSYAFSKGVYSFKHKAYDHQFNKRLFAFVLYILFNMGFVYWMPKTKQQPSTLVLVQKED